MSDYHFPDEYLPYHLAWDLNLLPDEEGKHEHDDLGAGKHQVLLASHNIVSCIWIEYDKNA